MTHGRIFDEDGARWRAIGLPQLGDRGPPSSAMKKIVSPTSVQSPGKRSMAPEDVFQAEGSARCPVGFPQFMAGRAVGRDEVNQSTDIGHVATIEPNVPDRMSLTTTVPALVPSLFQSS